jgi:hypothetical protein
MALPRLPPAGAGKPHPAPVADNQSNQNLLLVSIIGADLADLETTSTYGRHSILDRRQTHARGVVDTPGAKHRPRSPNSPTVTPTGVCSLVNKRFIMAQVSILS